jgi:hypothetical protein
MSKYKKYYVGGLINIGMGLAQAGVGAYQERQAKKKLAQAEEEAVGPIRTQAARQRTARQEGDAQAAVDANLRAEATAAEQLAQSGGARALAQASPKLQRATQQGVEGALDKFGSYGAQVSALEDATQLQDVNTRLGANVGRLERAADVARATKFGGFTQAAGGAAQVAGSLLTGAKKKNTDKESAEAAAVKSFESFKPGTPVTPAPLNIGLGMARPKPQFTDQLITEEDILPTMEEGGEVEKTPGEFDHDTNPIDIVQEGAKIGEMTGGEYIFNPEQAEELRDLAEDGDSELHRFIRNLLSKKQFK